MGDYYDAATDCACLARKLLHSCISNESANAGQQLDSFKLDPALDNSSREERLHR